MNSLLLKDIVSKFDVVLSDISFKQISQGYINDTFLVSDLDTPKFVLQRINENVFKDVEGLHRNLDMALTKLVANDYTQITLFRTRLGKPFLLENKNCWRLINYIPDSTAHNFTSQPKIAFEAGKTIGRFHQLLKQENISTYVDSISNLNFLPHHVDAFKLALNKSIIDWKNTAYQQIDFANVHLNSFSEFYKASLPVRICHNDTKLNNILFDSSNNGLCLIDLDTIMKGYFHYDFGDAVRTVVSESNEDEKNLNKINFNLDLFTSFIEGIKYSNLALTPGEINYLGLSCALMPFMHGLRALTDYLNGNIHYKVSYPEQNLDRCKSLFQFTKLALKNKDKLERIIKDVLN